MLYVITYPSCTELAKEYTVTPLPTVAETDAILIKSVPIDSTSAAEISGNSQGTLFIKFTLGSLTNVIIRMWGSYKADPSATDWYEETIEKDDTTTLGLMSLGGQEITLTANCAFAYHFPIGAFQAYKITVQGTGTATNSAITLNCALRVN